MVMRSKEVIRNKERNGQHLYIRAIRIKQTSYNQVDLNNSLKGWK